MDKLLIKERALRYGTDVLLPLEKLQLLTSIEPDAIGKCKSLIDVRKRLQEIQGTDLQLIRLNLFFKLMEEYMSEDVVQKKLDTPSEIYRFLKPKLAHLQVEKFYGVLLNAKLKLIDAVEISSGGLTCSIVHPREVCKVAIQKSAYALVCVHNHPSGDTKPSKEDIVMTKRLKQATDIIGIQFLDHLIVSETGYTSLKNEGYI